MTWPEAAVQIAETFAFASAVILFMWFIFRD